MRLDEETLSTMYEAEPNGSVDRTVIPGHPQILIHLGQTKDVVVPHVIVLGENDLNRISAELHFPGQTVNNVA